MDPITIRIIAGVLFVAIVIIIVVRRKKMASRRKPGPRGTGGNSILLSKSSLGFVEHVTTPSGFALLNSLRRTD